MTSDRARRGAMPVPHSVDRPTRAPGSLSPEEAGRVAAAIDRLAAGARPRIHVLVSPVAQPFTANVAAALRVDLSMTTDAEEVRPMAAGSDALIVNLGMLDPARRAGIESAVGTGRPFALDPVKVDRVPARRAFARGILERGPAIVRGNPAEMAALGRLAPGTVSVTTGPVDRVAVTGEGGALGLANGTPLLDRVVATGCAEGMLCAAMLPLADDARTAAIAAVSLLNVAAERAAAGAPGPGTFAARLLDALSEADGASVVKRLRLAPALDLTAYLVLGPDMPDPESLVRAAVAGGVSLVQWRDKSGSTADQVAAVRRLVEASAAPVLVNDRADVALAAGAAGVHVGHGDLDPWEARRIVGEGAIVGLTVHTMAEAEAADGAPIDYASVGGVFETTSKANTHPPIGIDGFAAITGRLRRDRPLPVCAIAGITPERARALAAAGADGVAVMSAVTKASDPAAAAAAIAAAVREGRG